MDEVSEFVALIEIAELDYPCNCAGEVFFTFFKDDAEGVALTWHHGKSLRWWNSKLIHDAALTDKSRANLATWLKKKGYAGSGEWEDALSKEQREASATGATP